MPVRVRGYVVALAVLAALAAVGAPGATAAHPRRAHSASAVGDLTATLVANVTAGSIASLVSFQYGTSTAYGSQTGTSVVAAGITLTISDTITGLQAGVTYHYRVAATGLLGTTYGADQTFTLAADTGGDGSGGTVSVTTTTTVDAGSGSATVSAGAGASGSGASAGLGVTGATGATGASGSVGVTVGSGSGSGSSSGAGSGASTASVGPPPPPTLDQTAVVDKTSGTVLVTVPGSNMRVPIAKSASVPSGSVIDADAGTVRITTALDRSGRTQSVVVADGTARVRYDKADPGRVELQLAGGDFAVCRAHAARAQASAASTRTSAKRSPGPVRNLWASDNHGMYTTQGNNSVATVRGTVWQTQDWCDGTLTRVIKGLVAVRDVHTGRTVLVRGGHSYFARA